MNAPLSRLIRLACLAILLAVALGAQAQTAYRWIGKDGRVHYSDQPPPPVEAKDLQQKKLQGSKVAKSSTISADIQKAAAKFPLTLYTSSSCKEICVTARDFLNERGLPFSEKSIQTFEEAAEYKKTTGLQNLVVPVLMAGDKTEKGFEENAWLRLLEATGYPTASKSGSAPSQ